MDFLRSVIADARPRQTLYGQPDGLNTMDSRKSHQWDSHALPEENAFPTAPDQSNRMNPEASIRDNNGLPHEVGITDVSFPRGETGPDYSVEMEVGDLLSADTPEQLKGEKEFVQQDSISLTSATFDPDAEGSNSRIDSYSAAAVDYDDGNRFANRQAHNLSAATPETPAGEHPASAYEENGTVGFKVGTVERSIEKKTAENGESFAGMKGGAGAPTADRKVVPEADDGGAGEGADHPQPQISGDDPKTFSVQAKATHGMVGPSIQGSSQRGENRGLAATPPVVFKSDNPLSDTDADNHSTGRQAHNLAAATQETPDVENPASAYEESGAVKSRVSTIERSIGKKIAENGEGFAGMKGGVGAPAADRKVVPEVDDGGAGEGADYPHSQSSGEGPKTFSLQAKSMVESSIQGSSQAGGNRGLASASNSLREETAVLNGRGYPAMMELTRQGGSVGKKGQDNREANDEEIASPQKPNGPTDDDRYVRPASRQKKKTFFHPLSDLKPVLSKAYTVKQVPGSDSPRNHGFLKPDASVQHKPGSEKGDDHTATLRSVPAMPVTTGSKPGAPSNSGPRFQYSKTRSDEPKVQIGQIDVIIEAPVQADKAPVSSEASMDLASRYYLRRL